MNSSGDPSSTGLLLRGPKYASAKSVSRMDLKASCAYVDPLASISIKRVAKETTHIRCQTWLAVQFYLGLCDKFWVLGTIDIYTQTIPTDIGSVKDSPLFHIDENVLVFSDEIRLVAFMQRVRQIS